MDEGGGKGVVCSCVAAVDVLGQLSAATWHAGLVSTAVRQCGRDQAD